MLVSGLRSFLEEYWDLPKGVGSNAEPANVEFILRRSGLRRYFRAIVDGHQVWNPKPHPEVFLKVAEMLGVDPADCIVFEDSPSGVQAGLAAGMKVVGLSTTFANLPGTSITADNFQNEQLRRWVASQIVAGG